MAGDAALWPSRFRPWSLMFVRKFGAFLLAWAGLVLAVALGSQFAWWMFGKGLSSVWFPGFCGSVASIITTVFWLRTRRGGRTSQRYNRTLLLTLIGGFSLTTALHFARYPAKQFSFLSSGAVSFELEPVFPTYREVAYTFRADPHAVMLKAREELPRLGYKFERTTAGLYAQKNYFVEYPGSQWLVEDSVSISPGRAVGKHFMIDGDVTDVIDQPGWVTVNVAQPELLPFWLRLFVP